MHSRQTLLLLYFYVCNCVIVNSQVNELQECVSDTGRRGTCFLIDKCQAALRTIRIGHKPKLCGFAGEIPIVCCENVESRTKSLAEMKCAEYKRKSIPTTTTTTTTTTGRPGSIPQPTVILGTSARFLEFPHMAILGSGSGSNIKWFCGGSLISENFILTAAHCMYAPDKTVSKIMLGAHNLSHVTEYTQTFGVKRTYPHPEYSRPQRYHDIALIELDRPADIQTGVRPACLHTSQQLPDISFTATGWGATQLYGGTTDILQKVYLRYVSFDSCARYYNGDGKLAKGLVDEWQICADGVNQRADTCQGDSGGPLHLSKEGDMLFTIVGLTSFGLKCALVPSVYTRVSHYVPWIENIVWST